MAKIDDIKAQVQAIRDKDDDEAQHSLRDKLWRETLTAIAKASTRLTKQDLRELAAEALKTDDIEFENWCA